MKLLLDCSLKSVFDIEHPRVGPAGQITGTLSFAQMRNGTGLDAPDQYNRVTFPDVVPHFWTPYTVECWFKAKQDHSTRETHGLDAFCMMGGMAGYQVTEPFQITDDLDGFNITHYSRDNGGVPSVFYVYWWDFLKDEEFHVAWTVDTSKGNQSGYARQVVPAPIDRKILAYKNGVLLDFHIANGDDGEAQGDNSWPINLGTAGVPTYDISKFVLQDLKVWEGVKTTFADFKNPRAGLSDGLLTLL